jgi:DNA polymerase III delta subunit
MAAPHPEKELERLRAACKQGLPPVVAIVGAGSWFRQQAVDATLAVLPKDFEILTVEGQDVVLRGGKPGQDAEDEGSDPAEDVEDAKDAQCKDLLPLVGRGLFSQSTAVVVRRADRWLAKHAAAVGAVIPRIQKGSLLLLDATKLDKRGKWAKELAASGAMYEFRELYETPFGRPDQPLQGELTQWVLAHAKRLGAPLTPESALLMISQVGKDPSALAAEIGQLVDQLGSQGGKKPLSPDDLRGKLTCSFESTPFEFAEAVLDGDRRRALRSLRALFARGTKQKDGKRMDQGGLFPFATSWMFSSIGQAYEGRLLLDQGISPRDLAQKAGVYSFQERFVANVQKHTAKKLEDGLLALLHCQRERRSLGEEDDVLLERFLARWFDGVATPGPEDLEW